MNLHTQLLPVFGGEFPRPAARWPSPSPQPDSVTWRWPEAGQVRVRKLLSRAAMRPIFRFHSVKLDRCVQVESDLERVIAQLLDACPRVDSYAEQSSELLTPPSRGFGRHVPDFAIVHRGRPWFVEAKYQRDVDSAVQERTTYLTEALGTLGVGYRLVTEHDLPSKTRVENARLLLQRGRLRRDPLHAVIMFGYLQDGQLRTLGDLGWDQPQRCAGLARDIIEGRLHVDLGLPLAPNTPVSIQSHEGCWLWA